jgi:uncharacterized membrane protein
LLIFLILMIDDLAVARVFHLLGIVHWIGGVAAVTTIVLPHARRIQERNAAIAVFESFERRFASQARISVAVTGLSGVYMLWRMMAWDRFELLSFWWLHLMVALWLLFALMLFIFEPLGMDRLFRSYAYAHMTARSRSQPGFTGPHLSLQRWLSLPEFSVRTAICYDPRAACRRGVDAGQSRHSLKRRPAGQSARGGWVPFN